MLDWLINKIVKIRVFIKRIIGEYYEGGKMIRVLRRKLYHIKNSIKYFFKRNLDTSELWRCAMLTEGGYMSKKTYEKIIKRECK